MPSQLSLEFDYYFLSFLIFILIRKKEVSYRILLDWQYPHCVRMFVSSLQNPPMYLLCTCVRPSQHVSRQYGSTRRVALCPPRLHTSVWKTRTLEHLRRCVMYCRDLETPNDKPYSTEQWLTCQQIQLVVLRPFWVVIFSDPLKKSTQLS